MPEPDRILAVSQQGGHLVELVELMPRMIDGASGVDWVTFDTDQGRSMLAGQSVRFVRPIMPRDFRALLANVRPAAAILRAGGYRAVVGSGAISLAFLPTARALGIGAHYIECATRMDGPSLTGRILAAVPGVRTYTQAPGWAGGHWLYHGTVFENFGGAEPQPAAPLRRVVVTLGLNPYPFRRALDRLVQILPPDVEVLWQTGTTDADGLGIDAHETLPSQEMDRAMREADVVIAHAGTGSALQALEAGRIPVLLPRRAAYGEQVDEHQFELARDLAGRGLALAVDVDELTLETLEQAMVLRARRREQPPPFTLA